MPFMINKQCPKCRTIMSVTPEAAKLGFVCPECKTFIGEKNSKLSDEDAKKLAQSIKDLLKNKE